MNSGSQKIPTVTSAIIVTLLLVASVYYVATSLRFTSRGPGLKPAFSGLVVNMSAIPGNASYIVERPKIMLFGDSLTERCFQLRGWGAGLANHYVRRADIVSRGFGGYNTRWALPMVETIFAPCRKDNTLFATVFLGANDAARPDGPLHSARQHVPLAEYKSNLKSIVNHVRGKGVQRVILITPPPVFNEGRKAWQRVRMGTEAESLPIDRTLDYTKNYAAACVELASELGLPSVDLFNLMQEGQPHEWGPKYFDDGLHFTEHGQQFVLDAVLAVLTTKYPDIRPEALPMQFPSWEAIISEEMKHAEDASKAQ